MSVDESTFCGWVDQELGPTPPAPADRLEWVIRAAGTNDPSGPVSRVPRRGYLALAVTLLSTGMMTGLLVKSRGGTHEPNARTDHHTVVTGIPSAPVDPVSRPTPGPASASTSARPSTTPTPAVRTSPPYQATEAPPIQSAAPRTGTGTAPGPPTGGDSARPDPGTTPGTGLPRPSEPTPSPSLDNPKPTPSTTTPPTGTPTTSPADPDDGSSAALPSIDPSGPAEPEAPDGDP